MQTRARIDNGANDVRAAGPGDSVMSQLRATTLTTVGAGSITAGMLASGLLVRTGPTGAYIDTLPTVAQLCAAIPQLTAGDSFTFILQNTVAYANTLAVGTGWTLGSNTAIAASLVREYLISMTATKPTTVITATTTNANATLTAVSDDNLRALEPGMVLSGTGITAGTTVLAVNLNNSSVVMSAVATATGTTIAITANPTATITGIRSSTL